MYAIRSYYVFTRQLVSAILANPCLQDAEIVLEDIDGAILERTLRLIQLMIEQGGLTTRVSATTSQRDALRGADFVINTFQVGGLV